MIEDKDYIMRLIHETVRTLIRLIWNRDMDKEEDGAVSFALLQRYQELAKMIDDGQVNAAENLLLDELDPDDPEYFEMALRFYEKLGGKSEEFLAAHDYSQQEVIDGLKSVVEAYGYTDLLEVISEELG